MIAPAGIGGGAAAAGVGAVDDVVVDQRGAVEELNYGGQANRTGAVFAGVAVAEEKQSGTQAFAAAAEEIAGDFGDGLESNGALPRELFLNENEIVADEIKDFFRGKQRDGRPPRLVQVQLVQTVSGLAADAAGCEARPGKRPVLRKKRRKFSAVAPATSSGAKSLTLASVRATSAT